MFCVVYLFKVKPEAKKDFLEVWEVLTVAILEHCGSLGSRLHYEKENRYIAYAQWPNEKTFDASKLPPKYNKQLTLLKESCVSIEKLHKLTTINDKLV